MVSLFCAKVVAKMCYGEVSKFYANYLILVNTSYLFIQISGSHLTLCNNKEHNNELVFLGTLIISGREHLGACSLFVKNV